MSDSNRRLTPAVQVLAAAVLVAGILAAGAAIAAPPKQAPAAGPPPTTGAHGAGSYVLLAWNDLGMRCYNQDFSDLAVLPAFNNLWAQVVIVGDPPRVVTAGVTLTYTIWDNSYSVGKSNFWTYAQKLFGLAGPLPANVGLTGKGLSGTLDAHPDHFEAVGIPLTEYLDSDLVNRYPYQLAVITVTDSASGAFLARTVTVAPVSTEMTCSNCHGDTGSATTAYPVTPTGKVETNILALHDYLSQASYPTGHTGPLMAPGRRPILCAECHASNALGETGVAGVSNLSNAMHSGHNGVAGLTQDTAGCYSCHPGPQTQCLRDTMWQEGMSCIDCHGTIGNVALNASPWLNEPRCDDCHTSIPQDQALYRLSRGHGAVYCEACHDSTHAIAQSAEPNDALKFIGWQGDAGTLRVCTACHASQPAGEFTHKLPLRRTYLPLAARY